MESKAISIGYISKVSAGNVNASHTEGNVMVTKKVTLPDGTTLPYISGQAIRRMIRDRLADMGEELAESKYTLKGQQEVTPLAKPWDYVDEDLFGYLDPSGSKRRTSPVRVSAAIGLFPFRGDRDLGTRSFEKFGESIAKGGNMFETELYYNFFRGAILVEVDRIGRFTKIETGEKDIEINPEEKRKRIKKFFDSLSILWGGGRTARMLVDFSPKFLAYARLGIKYPVFLENLEVEYEDGELLLKLEPIIAALKRVGAHKQKIIFGVDSGIFSNEIEIKELLTNYGNTLKIYEAIEKIKEDVDLLWKP